MTILAGPMSTPFASAAPVVSVGGSAAAFRTARHRTRATSFVAATRYGTSLHATSVLVRARPTSPASGHAGTPPTAVSSVLIRVCSGPAVSSHRPRSSPVATFRPDTTTRAPCARCRPRGPHDDNIAALGSRRPVRFAATIRRRVTAFERDNAANRNISPGAAHADAGVCVSWWTAGRSRPSQRDPGDPPDPADPAQPRHPARPADR